MASSRNWKPVLELVQASTLESFRLYCNELPVKAKIKRDDLLAVIRELWNEREPVTLINKGSYRVPVRSAGKFWYVVILRPQEQAMQPVRKILPHTGGPKLGTASMGRRSDTITQIEVGGSEGQRSISVIFDSPLLSPQVMLNPSAAVGLIKGLLERLPDVYVAADEDLLAMFKAKVDRATADAEAVIAEISRHTRPAQSDKEVKPT